MNLNCNEIGSQFWCSWESFASFQDYLSFEIHFALNQLKAARKINETKINQFEPEVL